MNKVYFSFIIPHRNTPLLLERCLNSIPQREDIEIIIVDDNSDDNLRPSTMRPDVIIVYLNKEETKWAGHARNIGINRAKGKWLFFADSDDYYTQSLIDLMNQLRDSQSDVVYFNYNKILNGNILSCNLYNNSDAEIEIIKYRTNAPWNKMVSRLFLVDMKIRFEEVINGNDMFFSYQVGYKARKIEVFETPVYNYDTTVYGMTNNKKNSAEYYLCRLNHWYQTNEFFKFIGHKEWQSPIFIRLLAVLWKKGLMQFFLCVKVYVSNYASIINNKGKFVNDIIPVQKNATLL